MAPTPPSIGRSRTWHASLADTSGLEVQARRIVERLASLLQASLLIEHSVPEVAGAFCASRLGGDSGRAFGTLPGTAQMRSIIDRAWPVE